MKPIFLSIILPTFNRKFKLSKALSAFKKQLASEWFEIIVINDGSQDGTKEYLEEEKKQWENLKVIHQKNKGRGAARETGLKEAKGKIILFAQDDIYPDEGFLETHMQFHKSHPKAHQACLGLIEWYPGEKVSRYMKWLTQGGPQFAYHKLKEGEKTSFWYFYTSNISIKKSLLQKHSFSPEFEGYGWEDIELAYRLQKEENLEIRYSSKALAYHDHPDSFEHLEGRMKSIAQNAKIFQRKHPDLNLLPSGAKKWILQVIASSWARKILRHIRSEWYWYACSKHYFLKALKQV